jgi:hypothetical protein
VLVTLHRPSDVDEPDTLREILLVLNTLAAGPQKILFAVHHRTRQRIACTSAEILAAACRKLGVPAPPHRIPPFWDGNTAARIVALLHPALGSAPDAP